MVLRSDHHHPHRHCLSQACSNTQCSHNRCHTQEGLRHGRLCCWVPRERDRDRQTDKAFSDFYGRETKYLADRCTH